MCLALYFLWEKDAVELPGGFAQDGLEDKRLNGGDRGWTKEDKGCILKGFN